MTFLNRFEVVRYGGIDGLSLPRLSRANLVSGVNGVGKTALRSHARSRSQGADIGADRTERLDIVPAQLQVLVIVRPKYVCRGCEQGGAQAPTPAPLVEGAIPIAGAIAHVPVSKFAAPPFARRRARLHRTGADADAPARRTAEAAGSESTCRAPRCPRPRHRSRLGTTDRRTDPSPAPRNATPLVSVAPTPGPRYHRVALLSYRPLPLTPEGLPMSSTTPKDSIGPVHSVGIAPRVIDPMHSTAAAPRVIDYPETDGQPMAETPTHRDAMIDAIQVLRRHFAHRPDVYVSGNMMMYYEEGEPRRCVSPDVFVAVGVEDKDRRTYLLWREAKGPDFVLEVTSKSTRRNDQMTKRALYEWMGVSEYVLYDPRGEYLDPPLQGFALAGGRYVELEGRRLPGGARALHSEVLGLSLHVRARDRALRLHDPASGEDLLTPVEAAAAREEAEARAERAEARAEREAAARGEAEVRAERADARTEREAAARREEAVARQAVEAENTELRARIREFERFSRTRQSPPS